MVKRSAISKKLLMGLAGLGVAAAIGACSAEPDSASTLPAESPLAEAPASPAPGSATVGGEAANATLDQVLANGSSFTTLNSAIRASGLEPSLRGPGPYTVFAPTNEAFAALPAGTLDQLLLPENKAKLQQVLSYHVVPGNISSAAITPGPIDTVGGAPVNVNTTTGGVTVENAKVVEADIPASNGVIHAIDQVLLPPGFKMQ